VSTSQQQAPAPAPGVVVNIAAEEQVAPRTMQTPMQPPLAAVAPNGSPDMSQFMQALLQQGQQTQALLSRLATPAAPAAAPTPATTTATTALEKIIPGAVLDPKLLPPDSREFLARTLENAGYHEAAVQMRGEKYEAGIIESTVSVLETPLKVKHVALALGGGLVLWGAYEMVATKMDWSFRVGIWDNKSSRR
jgi:hypothetical protein